MTWSDAMIPVSRVLLLVASLLIPGSVARPVSSAAQRDTIVKQAGRPLHPGGGTLVADRTIGVADGPQEYMFGTVRDVLERRDGSVLVVDAQSFAIRQYDAKGTHVRTIGRRGQGPGEFTRPGTLAELPDGRILLVDGGNARVNVYSPTGEPVDSWSLRLVGSSVVASRLVVDTTGTAVIAANVTTAGVSGGLRFLRFAPDGRIVDSLPGPDFRYTRPMAEVTSRTANVAALIPFFPIPVSLWSPLGYMVSGLPSRYAVELRTPRSGTPGPSAAIPAMGYRGPTAAWTPGQPIVSIRHTVPPVSVSDEQRAVERANVEAIVRNVDPTWRYTGPDIPRVKPPYKDLRVGDDGTIWVQLSMVGERYMPEPDPTDIAGPAGPPLPAWREPAVYDVFEPDGRYLGRVSRPGNVTLYRMARDHVWGTFKDEDDVAVVKRFRIEWR